MPTEGTRFVIGASLGLITLIGAASACATPRRAARECEPVPAAFSVPGQTVYRDCAVDRKARLRSRPSQLEYTPSGSQSCARAVIDVVVDSAGRARPETAVIVKATDPAYANAVVSSLEGMRYEPAMKDGQPVAQLLRYEQAFAVRVVVVPRGTSPQSVRPPRVGPPC